MYKEIKLGIIGFGRFGKLLTKILANDFSILVYDKYKNEKEIFSEAVSIGIELSPAPLSEVASCKIVIFCVPILHFSESLNESVQYFSKGATIIDVLSVKKYPIELMKTIIPKGIEILPTHPMFGPDTAAVGLKDLTIVFCPESTSENVIVFWRNYFESKGLKVIEMTSDEHDKITAYSICVTQLLGRVVDRLGIVTSKESGFDIDTKPFKYLLELRNIACYDSWELFEGLQKKNPYAKKMRDDMAEATIYINNILDKK